MPKLGIAAERGSYTCGRRVCEWVYLCDSVFVSISMFFCIVFIFNQGKVCDRNIMLKSFTKKEVLLLINIIIIIII